MIGICPIFCPSFNLNGITNQVLSIIDVCTAHGWCSGNKQRRKRMWPVRSLVQVTVWAVKSLPYLLFYLLEIIKPFIRPPQGTAINTG